MKEEGEAFEKVIKAFISDNTVLDAEKELNLDMETSNLGLLLALLNEELLRAHLRKDLRENELRLADADILPFKHIQKTIENKVQSVQY
jgi:hypothetical protein